MENCYYSCIVNMYRSFSSLPSSSYIIDNGNVFSCGRNDAFHLGQKIRVHDILQQWCNYTSQIQKL